MKNLKVYLFNVGQGDHTLIELPNGEFGIIDCKSLKFKDNKGRFKNKEIPATFFFQNYTEKSGENPIISFLIISHNDYDHISGLNELLQYFIDNKICVKNIFYSSTVDSFFRTQINKSIKEFDPEEYPSKIGIKLSSYQDKLLRTFDYQKKLLEEINGSIEYGRIIRNHKISSESPEIECVAPKGKHVIAFEEKVIADGMSSLIPLILSRDSDEITNTSEDTFEVEGMRITLRADRNPISLVIQIKIKNHSILFTGDSPPKIMLESIDGLEIRKSNCIKVSHHGSRNSSSEELWGIISSENRRMHAMVSAGTQYKHPHVELSKDIKSVNSDYLMYRTNYCFSCLNVLNFKEEPFEWYDNSIEKNHELKGLSKLTNKILPKKNEHKGLAAWVYEFDEKIKDPIVTIGMSYYSPFYNECPVEKVNCAIECKID